MTMSNSRAGNPVPSVPSVSGRSICKDPIFGGFMADLSPEDLAREGFNLGDSVDLSFSNGEVLLDVPVYNGMYAEPGQAMVSCYPGYPQIWIGYSSRSDLWEVLHLTEKETLSIALHEHGKYLSRQELYDLSYSSQRDDFSSDDEFANFRPVHLSGIRKGILFRSASPSDNRYMRAACTDALMNRYGIRSVLNLSETKDQIAQRLAARSGESPYLESLLDRNACVAVAMGFSFQEQMFRELLGSVLSELSHREGPYLVHCIEGKDRTGFVCLLLELLCYDGDARQAYIDTRDDYMETYRNYFGITEQSDKLRYDLIVRERFDPMFCEITGISSISDLDSLPVGKAAEAYLRLSGMSDADITLLKERLSSCE